MFSLVLQQDSKMAKVQKALHFATCLALIAMVLFNAFPGVFAQAENSSKEVIDGILGIIYLITNVVGIIFVIVGFVKLAIAYAQEDGPSQQKAALFIATGLVLILIRLVLSQINFSSWIETTLSAS